jgi:tetratricopeptide (TPR) repeat protein
VVPVTLALLLAGPKSIAVFAPLGLCLLLQIGTILTTASRFALVSAAVSLIVFGLLSVYTRSKEGGDQEKPKYGAFAAGAVAFVVLCLGVGPIRKRLLHPDQNSAAFRVWTWKGTEHMTMAHPLFGSGIGTYVFTYPVYALTGFTRLAHEAYLQVAAEAGIPALLVLLGFFAFVLSAGFKNSIKLSEENLKSAESWNQRVILCGVIAGSIAGLVQNLIDSDLYVFSCGTGLFAVLGLCAGRWKVSLIDGADEEHVLERRSKKAVAVQKAPWTPARFSLAVGGLILSIYGFINSIGAYNAGQANAEATIPNRASDETSLFQTAMQLCPLNGQYPSDFGYKVTFRAQNNPAGAENDLKNAVTLQPDVVSYRRLSEVLAAEGKGTDAINALDNGLKQSPHDLDLLLRRAAASPTPIALTYYKRVADLETTPVGTVRALDAIEYNFAIADANLADAYNQDGNSQAALTYYLRAASTLTLYFKRGGGHDAQQLILTGSYDKDRDRQLQALLDHCNSQIQNSTGK